MRDSMNIYIIFITYKEYNQKNDERKHIFVHYQTTTMATGEQYLFFQINRLHHVFSFLLLFFRMYVCLCSILPAWKQRLFTWQARGVFLWSICESVLHSLTYESKTLIEKKNNKNDDAKNIKKRRRKKKGRKTDEQLLFLHIYNLPFLFLLLFFNNVLFSSWKWR
jgi:hypothetical protein